MVTPVYDLEKWKDKVRREPVKTPIVPVLEGVLVQFTIVPETTTGGLLLTERSQESYETPAVLVLAVGPDVKKVKKGDKVMLVSMQNSGCIQHRDYTEGLRLYVITESHLGGIIEAPECKTCGMKIYHEGGMDHSKCEK